ncbi:hypothetical protein BUALT_BualtUnG0000900 [Buddleja alternifolia]|uniref:Uncharacterized protein n=1 Tax=Buddleja alternifolia TaxID=168488 RepID=A0AAV6W7Z9_9LAMI|nr:hypothetical protein BUALT_BualtUnG0000900 [Buddleja alternifolia]
MTIDRATSSMPDVGQWLMMSFQDKLPPKVATTLRASIFTLHHSVLLFIVLALSVLFNCIKASGLNISARYIPTPEWGRSWRAFLKRVGGGCNDLFYIGYNGGFTSGIIWLLVMHNVLKEVHSNQKYSVDCMVAIYMPIFLWKVMACFWPIISGDEPEDEVRRDTLKQMNQLLTTTSGENQPQQGSSSDLVETVGNVISARAESTEALTQRQSNRVKLRNVAIFLLAITVAGVCFEVTNDA